MLKGMRDILKEDCNMANTHIVSNKDRRGQKKDPATRRIQARVDQDRDAFPPLQGKKMVPNPGGHTAWRTTRNPRMETTWDEITDEPHHLFHPSAQTSDI